MPLGHSPAAKKTLTAYARVKNPHLRAPQIRTSWKTAIRATEQYAKRHVRFPRLHQLRMQVIQADRQRSKSPSCGVIDGVCDSRSNASQRDLTDALGADRIEREVRFVDKID